MFTYNVKDNPQGQQCAQCGVTKNVSQCLTCQYVGCTHLERDHSFSHFLNTGHCLSKNLNDMEVYDMGIGKRIMNIQTQAGLFQKSQEEDGMVDKFSGNMANEQMKNRELKKSFNDLESQLGEEKFINQQLKINQSDLNEDLRKRSIEITTLRKDLANEQMKNRELKINQSDLKEDLRKQSIEINELRSQVRDLMFHINSEQELKQLPIADELETSRLVVNIPSDKSRRKRK